MQGARTSRVSDSISAAYSHLLVPNTSTISPFPTRSNRQAFSQHLLPSLRLHQQHHLASKNQALLRISQPASFAHQLTRHTSTLRLSTTRQCGSSSPPRETQSEVLHCLFCKGRTFRHAHTVSQPRPRRRRSHPSHVFRLSGKLACES